MQRVILMTGASGYVGGRLLPRLERRGERVRCLARRPEFLAARVGAETEVVAGDVLLAESLEAAFVGVDTAYYLVHSMGHADGSDFEENDRIGARNFARAAESAGVRRIIYLGGLGEEAEDLSPHLRSRHEVGRILRESGVPVLEFRASVVIGSGSLSFEMIRALVERLPVMVTPRWVHVIAQPIAIDDLLGYLEAALDLDANESRVYEIGGSDRVSYGELMREYARQRGLRRLMIPVPFLTPGLSSRWLGLVTPLYARVGRELIESICHETVVTDPRAERDFGIAPTRLRTAIAQALANEDREYAETRWSDAISAGGTDPSVFSSYGGDRFGRRLVDSRSCEVGVPPEQAFVPIRRIGGRQGWYAFDWLWKLRGAIDLLFGGVGMRRGRPHPDRVHIGDALDWWRVEAYEPDHLLRLRAEMKLPGRAWLEFEVTPGERGSRIRQTASFDPAGIAGPLYWYGIYPLHALVFRRMLAGLASAAEHNPQGARVAATPAPDGSHSSQGQEETMSRMHPLFVLAAFVAVTFLAGAFGAQFTPGDWYESLRKPPLTPPNAVFGPVWSVLYLAIAVAAWRVWRSNAASRGALRLWSLQLLLNALWSLLFFGWHRPGFALLDIVVLLAVVLATTAAFLRADRMAGLLFIPYAAWVAFATYLNAGIWLLNR